MRARMNKNDKTIFFDALKDANNQLFLDAIASFQDYINKFPESNYIDDAVYNIALCYYELNQFDKCIVTLDYLIEKFPDSKIDTSEVDNTYGLTKTKASYLMIQSFLGKNDLAKAEELTSLIESDKDSFIIKNDIKITFYDLAQNSLKLFESI